MGILFSAFIVFISVHESYGKIDCHYCGIRKLCTLPYVGTFSEKITCAKSCMKFDGEASDGKRVIVRSCGFEDTNICNKTTEWNGSTGEKCICNAANCNNASKIYSSIDKQIQMLSFSFLVIFIFTLQRH